MINKSVSANAQDDVHGSHRHAYLVDELAAVTLGHGDGDATARLFIESAEDGVTILEWLHERTLSAAGIPDHESQGRSLHGVETYVRWPRMFVDSLGGRGNWNW